MSAQRPQVGIACHPRLFESYLAEADRTRLAESADLRLGEFTFPSHLGSPAPADPAAERELARFATDLDALIVCHGSPRVSREVLASAPSLRMVGELEGDRFAGRIDVAAAAERGIAVVDTSQGSSLPVAEWALALAILGLRDGGGRFRALLDGATHEDRGRSELTGKRVGLIGFGHIGWRLLELLRPFDVDVITYDPYAPRELADAMHVTFAPLATVLGTVDVVICLAPLTAHTRGMIGSAELGLLRPGATFVNVSRGAVVDTTALVARLKRGDITACLDVLDPEPIPSDAEILTLPNVFLSPHVAGTTTESRSRFFQLMVDELQRVFAGAEPRAVLTPRVLAGRSDTDLEAPA